MHEIMTTTEQPSLVAGPRIRECNRNRMIFAYKEPDRHGSNVNFSVVLNL